MHSWRTGRLLLLLLLALPLLSGRGEASPRLPEKPLFVPAHTLGTPPYSRIRLYVLTMDPGEEFYTAWGHTALLVEDPRWNRPLVFNYGMFNFDATFILRYLFDTPLYMLGLNRWDRTLLALEYERRTLYAQEVTLPPDEARALLDRLYENSRPENREYEYHHLYDNCTTRVRDLIDRGLEGELKEMTAPRSSQEEYRELAMKMVRQDPPYWLVLNLMLNSQGDQSINEWERMFLPHTFLEGLYSLRQRELGENRESPVGPLLRVGPDYTKEREEETRRENRWGMVSWGFVLFLYLFAFHLYPAYPFAHRSGSRPKEYPPVEEKPEIPESDAKRRLRRTGYVVWSLLAGGPGFLIALLWTISPRDIFAWNWNLLALNPLLLFYPAALYLSRRAPSLEERIRRRMRIHAFYLAFPLLGLFLNLTGLVPQDILPFALFAALVQGAALLGEWRRNGKVTR